MEIEKLLKELPSFETERLMLRKIVLTDLNDVFEFSSDPKVAHYMTWEANRAREDTLVFINTVLRNYQIGKSADWAVVLKGNNKVIGTAALVGWSNINSNTEIGYVFNRHYWGMGFATEALKPVINYCFNQLKINRVEARCDTDNIGSMKVILKLGMKYEGTLRKNEFIKGEFRDTDMFSIIREEFC